MVPHCLSTSPAVKLELAGIAGHCFARLIGMLSFLLLTIS